MNPELHKNPREEMELRLTALLLGELSAEEAATVRQALAQDPELSKLHDDLKETIHLVRAATTSMGEPASGQAAPLQLSEERRQKLLTNFVIPPLKPSHRKAKPAFQFRFVEALAVLAIIGVLAAMLLPWLNPAKRPVAVTSLPASKRAEEETVSFGVSAPEPAVAAMVEDRAVTETLHIPQGQSVAGVDPANVVGYVDVVTASAAAEAATRQVRLVEQIPDSRRNVSLGKKTEGQSRTDAEDYLKQSQRNLAAGQPASAPAAPVPAATTPQPRPQIVLPSLMDAETDGLADDGTRQKGREAGAVALFANGSELARSLDRNGRGPSGPTEAPVSQNQWAASSALRGFSESSSRDATTDFGLAADAKRSATEGDKALYDRYTLARNIAPTTGLPVESNYGLQPSSGANVSSVGDQTYTFGAFKADEFGRGLADGAEGKPGVVAAGVPVAPERFYRISPGGGVGGGGVGAGGIAVQNGTATPAAGDRVPVLGDVPTLGKLFVGQTTANRDGTVLADNLSTSNFDAPPAAVAAKPEAWFDAKNPRGDATAAFDMAVPDSGFAKLPALNLQEESKVNQTLSLGGIVSAEPEMRNVRLAETPVAEEKAALGFTVNAGNVLAFVPPAQSVADPAATAAPAVPPPPATSYGLSLGKPRALTPAAGPASPARPPVAEAEVSQRAFMERYGIRSDDRKLNETPTPADANALDGTQPAKADGAIDALGTVVQSGRAVNRSVTDSETKKGIAAQPSDPAQRLNESLLAGGLRGSRGRPLNREGKEVKEAGKPVDTEARLKSPLVSNPGDQTTHYFLNSAGLGAEAARLKELETKTQAGVEVLSRKADVVADAAAPSVQLESRSFRIDPEVMRQGIAAVGGEGVAAVPADGAVALPRVFVAGSTAGGGEPAQGSAGGIRFLTQTNSMAELHQGVRQMYSTLGVDLNTNGKSVFYNDRSGELFVRATPDDLAAIADVNQVLTVTPPEVTAKAKFEQLSEVDQKAVGFDWYLGYRLNEGKGTTGGIAVEIVDKAVPAAAKKPSLLARLTGNTDSQAVARIRLGRELTDPPSLSNQPAGVVLADARGESGASQATEILTSYDLATRVAEKLNLAETWGAKRGSVKSLTTAEAAVMLRQRLEIGQSKNSDLLEIKVKDEDAELAAGIANAFAQEFREKHLEWEKEAASAREQQSKLAAARAGQLALGDESDVPIRKPATNAPIPQPEIQTSENNFSTFSLNVSDVSFKLAAASLEKGQMPDAASVRSEEFINAFDYRDPEPSVGAPIAFAWERARYPFAHNRDLLRFSLKTAAAGRQAGRPLNVVLLLDNSGSMERADRVQIIHEALRVLASQLQPQDKLSVITFSRTPRLVADGISGDKAGEVAEAVSGLMPQGGTNLEDAMALAYQTAARHYLASGINRVVLLTDGAANLGNVEPESLKQKVEAQRKQGIALDCFGIGWEGFNDDLLEVLSRNGDGRYGFINSPEEAATEFAPQLAGALQVAASDVKVQVEFNPKRVTTYRQIGYAKHQLTKEQFRDNTVDAAEIAAQEAGNALYTVEVNPAGEGPLATVRVRYKIPSTTDHREQAWAVPFVRNAVSLEQSSPAMRLAASASAFSEWLVASPFAAEVTPDRLLGYLGGVPEVYGADERPKKLEWMIRQAKSVAGN